MPEGCTLWVYKKTRDKINRIKKSGETVDEFLNRSFPDTPALNQIKEAEKKLREFYDKYRKEERESHRQKLLDEIRSLFKNNSLDTNIIEEEN